MRHRRPDGGRLPDRFAHWSLGRQIAGLEKLARIGFDPDDLDGPQNRMSATAPIDFFGPAR